MNLKITPRRRPRGRRPSRRVLGAAAMFGLDVSAFNAPPSQGSLTIPIRCGEIVLITGPSGGGKTTLLKAVAAMLRRRNRIVLEPASLAPSNRCAVVDLFEEPLDRVVPALARAGLAEAPLLGRCVAELSDGQRFRLTLAQLMLKAEAHGRRAVIVIDEFASGLDACTARGVCRGLARWLRRSDHTLVVAGNHDVLAESLGPDHLVLTPLNEPPRVVSVIPAESRRPIAPPQGGLR
jgi:ABC-type ATPase with predicted acetyltransferase domain